MKVGTVATQFVVGETINGQTSGATATVDEIESSGTGANTIAISNIVGTFIGAENIRQGVTVRAPNVATNTYALGPSFTSLINGLRFETFVDKSVKYPSSVVTLTLSGLELGSDIVILQAGTSNILQDVDAHPGSAYSYVYDTFVTIDICIYKTGFIPFAIRNYVLQDSNTTLPIDQVADRNYQG